MSVEVVLPAHPNRADDYERVNPKDQPLKFLHPDGSVTDSMNTNVTASALPEGAATIDAAKTVGSLDFGAPYNIGLTIVVASNAKCTVIYE